MLSEKALSFYHTMLRFGCLTHIVPYGWDIEKRRLVRASRIGKGIHYIHFTYITCLMIFSSVRLANSIFRPNWEIALFGKIVNAVMAGAFTFTFILLWHDEMMAFTNTLLEKLEQPPPTELSVREVVKTKSSLSRQVLIAVIHFTINPIAHAIVVPAAPCTQNYLSSLFHDCGYVGDHNFMPLIYDIPWFFCEWSCGWQDYISQIYSRTKIKSQRDGAIAHYRQVQLMTSLLNSVAGFYLRSFPSLLFIVLALLLYGCILLWADDIIANLIFPACGARCAFESMTPLAMAGRVNDESKALKREWKQWRGEPWVESFKRSCPNITCAAGSMYTFESTIIIVSLDNLNQLTCNLLIAFQ
ncbi:hypothetical protein Fcan01_18136 [Folsomia candida]|uniref:Uncharacterized protein n=1 Tax=Folsomia candida TaxID=158441 RepID=A0A226DQ48_FOLCA|nr:hypothetical protein Fcan01_18136 [Folsomia candida]